MLVPFLAKFIAITFKKESFMHIQVHIKQAISSITNGSVGDSLIDVFFPSGNPIPKESILWDYKQQFIGEKIAYAELVKDIQSFFNSYGGYIFFGVSEEKKDEMFIIKGCEIPSDFVSKLRSAIQSYSSSEIDFNYSSFSIAGKQVYAIHIPQRPTIKSPVFLTRNGPKKGLANLFLTKKRRISESTTMIQLQKSLLIGSF